MSGVDARVNTVPRLDGIGTGDDMETLPDRAALVSDGLHKRLHDIIRTHVMHGFQSEIGQCQFCAGGELGQYRRVEVAGRMEWYSAGPDNITGMHDGAEKSSAPCFA